MIKKLIARSLPVFLVCGAIAAAAPRLKVSQNGRFLVYEDGRPFFYLGDTAWELFHRTTRDEADRYLQDRARKGFTVIQAVALAELDGLNTPNSYGYRPLVDNDPTRPDVRGGPRDDYWDHVEYILDKAESLGLVVGLLPTWGDKWNKRWGAGPEVFTPDNAEVYGEWLGRRYKNKAVIWILGGDNNPSNDRERRAIEALATGLKESTGGSQLVTFHPRGPGRSSDFFHKSGWLDFDMYQSSHAARDHDNGLFAEHDYRLDPPKPTLDGEPRYECIPVGFYFANMNRFDRFVDADVRQAAYWSLLAGACGHTYGNNNIWQMWAPGRPPIIAADIPWYQALDHPGAFQMGLVRRLFESRPYQKLEPRQTMVLDGPRSGAAKIRAARARDGSFAFFYSPRGEQFTVDQTAIKGERLKEIWYDPRYGVAYHAHTGNTKGAQTYTPPSSGRSSDWVLILEDAAENFPMPGASLP